MPSLARGTAGPVQPSVIAHRFALRTTSWLRALGGASSSASTSRAALKVIFDRKERVCAPWNGRRRDGRRCRGKKDISTAVNNSSTVTILLPVITTSLGGAWAILSRVEDHGGQSDLAKTRRECSMRTRRCCIAPSLPCFAAQHRPGLLTVL